MHEGRVAPTMTAGTDLVMNVGIDHATAQCAELLRGGAPGIHFYTLNESPSARAVFENLRFRKML